jgi:hypothetical protein
MVRRVDNVNASKNSFRSKSKYVTLVVSVGSKRFSRGKMLRSVVDAMASDSMTDPVLYLSVGNKNYWRFRDHYFVDSEGLASDEIHALLVARGLRLSRQIERAKTIAASGSLPRASIRRGIPEDIRLLVWQRDGGECTKCGGKTELQFDHIIPLSHGGASTEDNLQVLCASCNRAKGTSIV